MVLGEHSEPHLKVVRPLVIDMHNGYASEEVGHKKNQILELVNKSSLVVVL